MAIRTIARLCIGTAFLALAGCASLQRTEPLEAQVPESWQHAQAGQPTTERAVDNGHWWRSFADPDLEALINRVLVRNGRIAEATIAVRRARLQAGIAAERRRPSFGSTSDAQLRRGLGADNNSVTRSFSVEGAVSYDVDPWGKLATEHEAAALAARAVAEDKDSVAMSVVSTTMALYWRLAFLNEKIDLTQQNVTALERILELTRIRHNSGALSRLDVHRAEQALFAARAGVSELQQQREVSRNALAILLDGPPQALQIKPARLPRGPLPGVDLYLPAHVVKRRPDLRAAELRLREALAGTEVARSSFYPTLKLTGGLGSSSIELSQLLMNPAAVLGVGLTLPFLQMKELRLNQEIAQADYEKAVLGFRQALYRAFSEVEDALSARARLEEQRELLEKSLGAAEQMTRITEIRYRAGAIELNLLLDAQQTLREAEAAVLENRLNRLTNLVELYIALGGDARVED